MRYIDDGFDMRTNNIYLLIRLNNTHNMIRLTK